MNNKKLVLSIIILGASLFLGSCSSKSKIDKISSDVQTLNSKLDQFSNDLNTVHSDVQNTKDEANRANQRLDNQAMKYRK